MKETELDVGRGQVTGEKIKLPSLHQGKEGWLRHQTKRREASEADADGVVFRLQRCCTEENHPVLSIIGSFAPSLLIASPPLLALMQGGGFNGHQFNNHQLNTHMHYSQVQTPSFLFTRTYPVANLVNSFQVNGLVTQIFA